MDKFDKPVRVNMNVSSRVHVWFTSKAQEMGTSRSALMCFALDQFMTQSESVDMLSYLPKVLEKLDNLEKGIQ